MAAMGGMKVTSLNGVKVYTVSGQRSLATWLNPAKLNSLRKDEDYRRRIELLQDLQFDTAATKIKATPDGQYLVVSGTYPPQMKVYELNELSIKFERHLVSEIIDFQVLNDDYSKLAFLCADRSVCLHAKFGSYFSTRIPRMGRDLAYDCWSCDLLVAGSSSDIYRLNLEQGQFFAPLHSRSPGTNVLGRSPVHGLIAGGGEDGAIECFDLRQKAAVGRIENVGGVGNEQEVTALRFEDREGMLLAAGTSSGQVILYDLRSSVPLRVKDHMYGSPIIDIKWHETLSTNSRHLISADSRVVRIWDPQTGNGVTSIEAPSGDINDICVYPGSGLLFMALDSPQISSYFIPTLGPAPKWCSFLENLTEELEENPTTTIYDDFKFVTRKDLERLNLTNLLGSNLLRAYMHGFFIDYRLYQKAKALADPFAYEAYHQQLVQQKLDAARANRITIKKKLPKINQQLAERLLSQSNRSDADASIETVGDDDENLEEGRSRRGRKSGPSVLADDRFSAMFKDEAFQIDEEASEFQILHPNAKKSAASGKSSSNLVFEDANDSSERSVSGSDSGSESGSDSDENAKRNGHVKRKRTDSFKETFTKRGSTRVTGARLHEARAGNQFGDSLSLANDQRLPLGERVKKFGSTTGKQKRGLGGSREISFNSSRSSSATQNDTHRKKRRSVGSLGLSSGNVHAQKGNRRGKRKG